jgi:hypothetical protein
MCAAAKASTDRTSTISAPSFWSFGVEWPQRGLGRAVHVGAAPVPLPQSQEVRRVAPEAAEEQVHERVLVLGGEQRVGGLLAADGRDPIGPRRGAAERTCPVRRVDGQVLWERQDALV